MCVAYHDAHAACSGRPPTAVATSQSMWPDVRINAGLVEDIRSIAAQLPGCV